MDIDRTEFYEFTRPELEGRTRERLTQIKDLNLEEVGLGEFGIKGIFSGLYLERVWSYSDNDWNDYIDWIKTLI